MKISLAMIVKNAESTIERSIKSSMKLVDEFVIVDTGSTDNTISIINKYPNIILEHYNWCDDFSAARNYSIEKTSGDYVLVLDSDEYILKGSRCELEKAMVKELIGRVLILSNFKKDTQIFQAEAYVSRFFPREIRYIGGIHEQLDSHIPRINLEIKVEHDGYFETNKSARNIPLLVKEVKRNPTDPYYLFQLGKELRISKRYEEAFHFLVKSYGLVKDSVFYYGDLVVELINSGKECGKAEVLNIISQNEEILDNVSDFHFAKGMFYMDFCLKNPSSSEKLLWEIERSFLDALDLNSKDHTEYVQGTSSYLASYNLGVFYEVTGNTQKANKFYNLSSAMGYKPATKRLEILKVK